MESKTLKRRRRLFSQYSANLESERPAAAGQYACPLCLKLYLPDEVEGDNPLLTLEHVIPNGLGNAGYVLTCKECNNTAGSDIDGNLHKQLSFSALMNGKQTGKFRAQLAFDGDPVGATIQRTAGALRIEIEESCSNPISVQKLEASMEHLTDGDEMSLRFTRRVVPDIDKSSVAFLKAAYLAAFRHFGYRYILWDYLDPVRQTIKTCEENELALNKIILKVTREQLPKEIMFVKIPAAGGIAVPLHFSTYGEARIVVIPNDDSTHSNWLELEIGERLRLGSIPDSFFPWKTN